MFYNFKNTSYINYTRKNFIGINLVELQRIKSNENRNFFMNFGLKFKDFYYFIYYLLI